MSRLIVNADDFGYTEGIDQAVLELHERQALSSTTAMACGTALPAYARDLPASLGIGCHVVLVDGIPQLPASQLPTLTRNGHFQSSLPRFALAVQAGRLSGAEIRREAEAQIQALLERGFAITHVDTHKHTHLFPAVLRPVLAAARACGIGAIRNPFEPAWARIATPGASLMRRAQLRVFDTFHNTFLREVERSGLDTTAGALGVLATGVLDALILDKLLFALSVHGGRDKCYELVCHPGFHDGALDAQRTRLRAERERERTALERIVPRWTAGTDAPHTLVSFAAL